MLSIIVIVWILFAHWVADFVCQNDMMALNKSKSNKWLGIHCIVYTFILLIMTLNPLFAIANGVMHFVIDYETSRLNSKLWKEEKVHYFFVSVGFDQFLHVALLLFTYAYFTKAI